MFFNEIINKNISDPKRKSNSLSDENITIKYLDLSRIFSNLDKHFDDNNIYPNVSIALKIENRLCDLILLIYLLYKNYNIVLLQNNRGTLIKAVIQIPFFCDYILMSKPETNYNIFEPVSYLEISKHENKIKNSDYSGTDLGNVFLKTSGSTDEPKLVKHTIANLLLNSINCVGRFRLKTDDRILIPVPIYHMYGFGAALLPALIKGASVCLLKNTNIIKLIDFTSKFMPSVSYLSPSICEMLVIIGKKNQSNKLYISAGDRIKENIFHEFENKIGKLINLYGSTELGAIATNSFPESVNEKVEGIIKPMPKVKIKIENIINNGKGDIYCMHTCGFSEYVNLEGKTLYENKDWFATQDLGMIVNANSFKIIGRKKNSINRNGILISFSETEALIEAYIKEVKAVVLTAKDEDTMRGNKLIAICELNKDINVNPEDIRSLCKNCLSKDIVPDEVYIIKEMPLLPNNKIDRKKVTELYNK